MGFLNIALFQLYHTFLSFWWLTGGTQKLLSPTLNPTTVMIVLLGLCLLLGCDKRQCLTNKHLHVTETKPV